MPRPSKEQKAADQTGDKRPLPGLPGMSYLPYARAWRLRRGYKLSELAAKAKIGKTTLIQIELLHERATADTYAKLAKALKIMPSVLLHTNPEDIGRDDEEEGDDEGHDAA